MYTSTHAGGPELTKLTYFARLVDNNPIRLRGDRLLCSIIVAFAGSGYAHRHM